LKGLYNKVDKKLLKEYLLRSDGVRITLSFYKYTNIANPVLLRDHLYTLLTHLDIFGRIYISSEGVNAQMSIPKENFEAFKNVLDSIDFLQQVRLNIAVEDDGKSFYVLIIKIKDKIVADGLNDYSFDVTKSGTHLTAKEFNELTDKEETIIVDMRNHYESEVGHFKNAIMPDVETFRESLKEVKTLLENKKERNIIMYCTGGIRCEKASAYYKHIGFKNVYQLDGGIIEYAREVEKQGLENKFIGKNFVFDERLGEKISEDIISKCHQCGKPCDEHTNCINNSCHILFIQCLACEEKYSGCCSHKCKEFNQLPMEEKDSLKMVGKIEFNGTKFGKGRYKANKKAEPLIV